MTIRRFLCRSHPDAHMPPELEIGRGFDGAAYGRRMKEAGADLAIAFAKCHYGHAYYPTTVGTPHPRLVGDVFGETVRGLHANGLGASAYLSVHLDGVVARQHPEWLLQGDPRSTAGFDSGRFPRLCVNSGYLAESFIPQCREVAERYEVDEFFLDTMPGFAPCYCPVCREGFGKPIPEGPQDETWLEYARWYAGCFDRFYIQATEAIHQVRQLPVLWNWRWTWNEPAMPNLPAGRLAADAIASPGGASVHCRYFAGTGLGFDFMCGRFAHGLAEWNNNYQPSLDLTAAETVAHGGSFWLIDRQLPDGSLEERGWEIMRRSFAPIVARKAWLHDTDPVFDTAVLSSLDHILAPDRRHFPNGTSRRERGRPIEATLGFLAEHGRGGCAMPRERLIDRLADLRLVILPDTAHLDDALVDALLPWVEAGGRVLATMPADGETTAIARLACVDVVETLDTTHAYVDGPEPLLTRKPWYRLRLHPGTEAMADLRLPLLAHFGHGVAPVGPSAGCPAAVRRARGKGAVILAASTLFSEWWMWASPGLEALLLGWIDELLPDPIARVDHPGQVELATQRQGDDLILHLINRCGRTRLGGWHFPMSRFVPPLHDVPLFIAAGRTPDLTLQPEGTPLPCTAVPGGFHTVVPRLDTWQTVVVRDHFTRRLEG